MYSVEAEIKHACCSNSTNNTEICFENGEFCIVLFVFYYIIKLLLLFILILADTGASTINYDVKLSRSISKNTESQQ